MATGFESSIKNTNYNDKNYNAHQTFLEFKERIESIDGLEIGNKEKIFWEISRCSDRHEAYMLKLMEEFTKLPNEEKIEVVQMLWGAITTNREQLAHYIRKSGEKCGDPHGMKPEYFFGGSKKWV